MPFDGSQLSTTTQALIDGRHRIGAGWCQGVARSRGGGVCAVEAVSGNYAAIQLLQRAANTIYVAQWNDAPWRKKEDVLAVYDQAISWSMRSLP
jgi:hypothetical protein